MKHSLWRSFALLVFALHASWAAAQLTAFQIGDQVDLYANGPQVDASRLGSSFPDVLFRDINLGRVDPGGGGYAQSSSGLYASAGARAGVVGAEAYLDWINPIDYWDGRATADTADVVSVSNPAHPNSMVSVLVQASVSGGLGIFGPAAEADAVSQFYFEGISGLQPFGGGPEAPYYNFFGTTGYALIFQDRAYQRLIDYTDDGFGIFQTRYEYGQRNLAWIVDVLLDASGNGSFWTLLDLAASADENGQCRDQCGHFGSASETGSGASDYAHTVSAYFLPVDAGTTVTSAAGWAPAIAPPNDVPEPPAIALVLSGLMLLGVAFGRRRGFRAG